ncbi:MAG: MFS transporter, partial [Cyclobacteriaceae bacterium]
MEFQEKLPLRKQIAYACGMLGWSIMINVITVMLIYFYLPPVKSGLVNLVPQFTILGVFNAMALIASSGRFVDAITDPLIAFYSDNSKNPKGRRIPFMKFGVLPSFIFCVLIFVPLSNAESVGNVAWLTLTLMAFFFSLTIYIIPYNALLPELGHNATEKLRLSTWLSMAFVIGIIISSQTPILADLIEDQFSLQSRM